MGLKIERTVSWQIEGAQGSYCATTYSKHDAVLVRKLAEGIPHLRCLKGTGHQPKGYYTYVKKGQKSYPLAESYDIRLFRKIERVKNQLRGD